MRLIVRFRIFFLVLVAALVSLGVFGMQRLRMDSSNESFFPENNQSLLVNERFKEIFGNEEYLLVLIEAEDIFTRDGLTYIRELSRDLGENLPFAADVLSITEVDRINGLDNELSIEPLVGDVVPTGVTELEALRERALSESLFLNRIVTADSRAAAILVTFERIPRTVYLPAEPGFAPLDQTSWPADEVFRSSDIVLVDSLTEVAPEGFIEVGDPRKLIAPAFRAILEGHPAEELTVLATGAPIIDFGVDEAIERESVKSGGTALVIAILLLTVLFRSAAAVAAPVTVALSTIAVVYGAMGFLGLPLTMTSVVIATLLLVISVSYSIHVIHHFQHAFRAGQVRKKAVRYAVAQSGWPCLVTAVTTAIGFASFLLVPIGPIRHVGAACALGTLLAYLLVMVLTPVFLSFGSQSCKGKATSRWDFGSDQLGRWADVVNRNTRRIGMVALGVSVLMIGLSFNMRVDNDFMNMLGDDCDFVSEAYRISDRMGGMYSYEVLVELPEAGMANDPAVLGVISEMSEQIESWESTAMVTSYNDLLRELNLSLNDNDAGHDVLPESRALAAQLAALYEMSGGDALEDWVDFGYRRLRVSVQVRGSAAELEQQLDELVVNATEQFPEGTQVTVAGDMPMMFAMMDLMTQGQMLSILAALGAIALTMIVVFRSFWIGLLSMIPNLVPVLVICGLMGLLSYPVDMVTILIVPMIIGIAVDDTVHFVVHYRQAIGKTGSYSEANRRTFKKVGRALLLTTIVLSMGFSAFGLSSMDSMIHLAVVSIAGIVSALLADLLVMPVVFSWLRPFGRKIDGTKSSRTWPKPEIREMKS